jgi:hypothetical protein
VIVRPALFTQEEVMGLMDTIKGLFGGPVNKFVDKLVAACEGEIERRASEIKARAEDEAKGKLKQICMDVGREKLGEITSQDPTGMAAKFGDQILEKASDKLVDKVWDKVKDKIVQKAA